MRRLLFPCVVALLLLPELADSAAQGGTPGVSTPRVEIPASPVGDQLAWVFAQFNGGAATLTEHDITARFAPAFLTQFLPAPDLLDLLRQTATEYAPITVTGLAFPPTATGAVARVELATGEHAAIYITVEPEPPHRITRLDLSEAPAQPSPIGRRVAVGGRALYIECTGSGSPTVVLEAGIASDWTTVQPHVAEFARVCSYDRPDSPGSRSDPTSQRTAQEVVDDLRAMLITAGETGPYVLVGHSLGGLYVQLYAYQHADEVGGLVLVDPTHEEFSSRLADLLLGLGTPVPRVPPEPDTDDLSFTQMREARASRPFPPMPLIVLSHGRLADPSERPPGWPVAEEKRIWRELHAELAQMAPGGRHIIAETSGHDIPQEQPQLVVEAIQAVVAAARDPSVWATPRVSPAAMPYVLSVPHPRERSLRGQEAQAEQSTG
jgi:pimeloyl-ACP methyl ester carboxylesterase